MKRCLLFAPLVSHATEGRIAALGAGGYELYVVDISTRPIRHNLDRFPFSLIKRRFDLNVREVDPLFGPGRSRVAKVVEVFRSFGIWPENKAVSSRVRDLVLGLQPSVIVLYYGPSAVHFGRMLRRLFPTLPLVMIHNTFPVTVQRRGRISRWIQGVMNDELADYRHWLSKLDFFVHASPGMVDFARRQYSIDPEATAVLPDYFSSAVHANVTRDSGYKTDSGPRVIFLGAPERWGNGIDDIDSQFLSLAREGVTVHSGAISDEVVRTGYGFKYPFFTDDEVFEGALARYAHGFDAALITYAVDERMERFRTTLPTRFFTALTAGIPIAVRAGLFDAVEAYVEEHGLGFSYRTARDLREKLDQHDQLSIYRKNAINHMALTAAENQAALFESIFDRLSSRDFQMPVSDARSHGGELSASQARGGHVSRRNHAK
jgi:hypothetical protein